LPGMILGAIDAAQILGRMAPPSRILGAPTSDHFSAHSSKVVLGGFGPTSQHRRA